MRTFVDVPEPLAVAIGRMLARDRGTRVPDMREVAKLLAPFVRPESYGARAAAYLGGIPPPRDAARGGKTMPLQQRTVPLGLGRPGPAPHAQAPARIPARRKAPPAETVLATEKRRQANVAVIGGIVLGLLAAFGVVLIAMTLLDHGRDPRARAPMTPSAPVARTAPSGAPAPRASAISSAPVPSTAAETSTRDAAAPSAVPHAPPMGGGASGSAPNAAPAENRTLLGSAASERATAPRIMVGAVGSSNDRRPRRRSQRALAPLAIALSLVGAGCGGAARRAADPGPIMLAPPAAPPPLRPAPAPAPVRPGGLAIWAHIEQPDVLVDVLGLSSTSFWSGVAPYAELVDLRQPVDVLLVAQGGKVDDIEPVVRLHFKDAKALFALVAKDFRLREDGDRVFARPRSSDGDTSSDDEEWECDFVRGGDAAVCGSPKAVTAVADWSKPGPAPPRPVGAPPIVRIDAYADALVPLLGDVFRGTKLGSKEGGELAAFLSDAERFSLELAADGDQLHAIALWRLRSQVSRPAQDLLAAPNVAALPDVFHRVAQETKTAVFVSGGGAMPRWIAELVRQSQALTAVVRPAGSADPAGVIGSFVSRPAVIGYGARLDRARSALDAARTAKNADKALRSLDDALEPQLVFALAAPIGSVEHAMRSAAAPSAAASGKATTGFTVRPASARLGLPKGSFIVDERGIDWVRRAGTAPAGAPPVRATYTLFASAFDGVLGVTCPAEELCAEAYRRLTAKAEPPRVDSELFRRDGLVAAGWVMSSIGVQQVNRIMLKTATPPVSPDVLANVERDLLAPRFRLPFVVTTKKEAAGGTVMGEMRASRDAFRAALDQGLLGSSWGIARMLLVLFGGA